MQVQDKTPRGVRLEASVWIQAVDGAGWRLPAWAAALAGLALPWLTAKPLVDAAIPLLAAVHNPDALIQSGLRTAGLLLIVLGPLCLLAWLSTRMIERRKRTAGGARRDLAALVGVVLGGAGIAMAVATTVAATGAPLAAGSWSWPGLGIAAVLVLAQAAGEEIFFRAWLQPVLAARWGVVVGLVVTSVIFAVAHAAGGGLTPLSFLNDTLAGALFGLLALKSGRLGASIAAHFAWNFGESNVFGASPTPDAFGSILHLGLTGPTMWTGGAEGLNGALSDTVALLILLVVAQAAYRPRLALG